MMPKIVLHIIKQLTVCL